MLISPVAPREAAVDAASQATLDRAIAGYVEGTGLPFLDDASGSVVCASASQASNATVAFEVVISGTSCVGVAPPSSWSATSSLTLTLPSRTVVVEAWLARQ